MRPLILVLLTTAINCFTVPKYTVNTREILRQRRMLGYLPKPRGLGDCGVSHFNLSLFFSTFRIPAGSNVVLGGYLPTTNISDWQCQTTSAAHKYTGHGVYIYYTQSNMGWVIGVGMPHPSDEDFQLFIFRGQHTEFARLRICKWTSIKEISPSGAALNQGDGRDCLVDRDLPFVPTPHHIYGLTWKDGNVRFLGSSGVYTIRVPGSSRWTHVSVWCGNAESCAYQVPDKFVYYNVSVNHDGLLTYSPCLDEQLCMGVEQNIFAPAPGGYIPPYFSFNNWYVLTNSSTILAGTYNSYQPMIVDCLVPIPKFAGVNAILYFNHSQGCNGASSNGSSEAMRFNINSTDGTVSRANKLTLYTINGLVDVMCYNTSTPTSYVDASILFGNFDQPYFCFASANISGNVTIQFIGLLPKLREVVITTFGQIYFNGVKFIDLAPIYAVHFDLVSTDFFGFWTVAYTSWAHVLLEVNQTNILRLGYCDTPLDSIKCAQLSFYLQDGFYPLTTANVGPQPEAFVTLPTFNLHTFFDVELEFSFRVLTVTVLLERTSINFPRECVGSNQFTLRVNSTGPQDASLGYKSTCPFDFNTINNYLQFGRVCFYNSSQPGACTIVIQANYKLRTFDLHTVWVVYSDGSAFTGVPHKLSGLSDISFFQEDVCSLYTIYGRKGQGVIRSSDQHFLSGLYYTSLSGQLLAFKNVTSDQIYTVTPCTFSSQGAVVNDRLVGIIASNPNTTLFNNTVEMPTFFYHSDTTHNCSSPVLEYSGVGICGDGSIVALPVKQTLPNISPMMSGLIAIPSNFTMAVVTEYLQLFNNPVSVDCAMYVCNGNERCNVLLTQYTSACQTIERALQSSARLEAAEVSEMITASPSALNVSTIDTFPSGGYNFTSVLSRSYGGRSFIEDVLFEKVVTTGLGTVDQDYKACSKGLSIADLACAQYYSGIMVLPGVVDSGKMAMYTASLLGGMVLGGLTSAAATPFSIAVQARLNYVALQTNVLQRNQQILAESFNYAMGNITEAFSDVKQALSTTAQGLSTVAQALSKVQDVVNTQSDALNHLTKQLQHNFQTISNSISDIYGRLNQLEADAQVDRIIVGRIAALNAFVSQALTRYTEVQASRKLALQKVNECVKSQSKRFGFCGNDGEHIFSVVQAAPQGLLFLHTVLKPDSFVQVHAVAGLCVENTKALVLRQVGYTLFVNGIVVSSLDVSQLFISPRKMFEPRKPQVADFVQVSSCELSYFNITMEQLPDLVPDFVDVNKTLEEIFGSLPNFTVPQFPLDVLNQTYLNLTSEIHALENKSEHLNLIANSLQSKIDAINATLVDLQWLNRVESYVKWPWWVWLLILIALILTFALLTFCCLATGCCGCCGCIAGCCSGCCKGPRLQPYEPIEKVHIH
uniref:Spike protein n=1 Tax=Chaerephon bat coronavirus/Kenya/KY41/2006 TaxID=983923 RepID=F1DAY3_9ALPC|nr:spike protein [Chaerephon bat coronavirus/Kenya/KY41/2006]